MAETVAPQPLTITGEALRGLSREELPHATRPCRCPTRPTSTGASPIWRASTRTRSTPSRNGWTSRRRRCSISIRALRARDGDRARHRDRARRRRASRSRRSRATTSCSGRSSARTTSSRPRTRATLAATGCSCVVPHGRRARAAALRADRELGADGGSLVLAPARRRRGRQSRVTLIEEYVSASSELAALLRTRRSSSSSAQAAKLEYVSIQNLSRETWHFATHRARVDRDAELDWVAGGFGSKQRQDADRERPRRAGAHRAGDRHVLRRRARSTSTTTRSRSTSRPTPRRTSRSGACCATTRARSGAG